ncbi:DNA topoisomerase IV [Flavobacterium sp.]|uniref:DNA topoisomerase IV n=1 Tax=Flavobacterium sp. TaxID=239 RepID=UPI003B9C7A46
MKTNCIVLLLILCLFSSCYNAERNCSDFKNGKFSFTYEENGKKQTTVFVRKDSIEIETYKGKTDTSTVRWVNDCEYILQKKNPKNRQEQKGVVIRILSTTKNSYTFEFGLVGSQNKSIGTAILLDN